MSPAWFSIAIFTPASTARATAARRQTVDGLLDVPVDAAVGQPVLPRAEHDTDHRGPERARDADAKREVLVGGAPVRLERLRGRADAPCANLNLQPPRRRVLAAPP